MVLARCKLQDKLGGGASKFGSSTLTLSLLQLDNEVRHGQHTIIDNVSDGVLSRLNAAALGLRSRGILVGEVLQLAFGRGRDGRNVPLEGGAASRGRSDDIDRRRWRARLLSCRLDLALTFLRDWFVVLLRCRSTEALLVVHQNASHVIDMKLGHILMRNDHCLLAPFLPHQRPHRNTLERMSRLVPHSPWPITQPSQLVAKGLALKRVLQPLIIQHPNDWEALCSLRVLLKVGHHRGAKNQEEITHLFHKNNVEGGFAIAQKTIKTITYRLLYGFIDGDVGEFGSRSVGVLAAKEGTRRVMIALCKSKVGLMASEWVK